MLGIGADIYNTNKSNKQQREHDEAMAALNHRYREEEAESSFAREVNFNQYEADVQKMQEAGISPSLMYGGSISPAVPSISSVGSSQGAGNVGKKPDISSFLGKLDPLEYGSQTIERMNAQTMKEKTRSDIMRNNQDILESISRQNENMRNTAFKKSVEGIERDQMMQTLHNLELQGRSLDFDIGMKTDLKPLQMRKAQLENDELVKRIDYAAEQIKTEPYKRAQLASEVRLANKSIEEMEQGISESKERVHMAVVDRVMKQVGLNARSINPAIRTLSNISPVMQGRISAGVIALEEAGIDHDEAVRTVLYYCATDTKDVTPSSVNAFSRIVSSLVK